MTPRGIRTNGIGQHYSGHLNLTRSLADVWSEEFAAKHTEHRSRKPVLHPLPFSNAYRLKNEDGAYLHQSGQGLTPEREYAWKGTAHQLEKIQRALPLAKGLKVEFVS
jgi:hypothetical protein